MNSHTMFPVPKDVVNKLIELLSSSGAVCNECKTTICPTLECNKCGEKFNAHDRDNAKYDCVWRRHCADCGQIFCKKCVKGNLCKGPLLKWNHQKQTHYIVDCIRFVTKCEDCLAKYICEQCGLSISRCAKCTHSTFNNKKHICGEGWAIILNDGTIF